MSNQAYKDRNLVVQLLALLGAEKGWKSEMTRESENWIILYINTDFGQLSWHIPSEELQVEWPEVTHTWDGHSTSEKNKRIENIIKHMARNDG